jgi:hypothetical protein
LVYLQEGRFSATVGTKKHPELSRRNPKRAVLENRHHFLLPRRDREIQIPTLDGNILSSISPVDTESKIYIHKRTTTRRGKSNRKIESGCFCPAEKYGIQRERWRPGGRGRVRRRRRRKKRSRGTEESREIHTSIYTMTVKLVLTAKP